MSVTTYPLTTVRSAPGHDHPPDPASGVDQAAHSALHLAHRGRRPRHLHRPRHRHRRLPGGPMGHHDGQAAPGVRRRRARSMIGLLFAAVVLGALAVRTITAEYSTGMIRATFAARPARRAVLAAKAATMAAFAVPGGAGEPTWSASKSASAPGRQARPSVPRPSRRAAGHALRGRGGEPHHRHRRRPGRHRPAHRRGHHGAVAGPHRGCPVRPVPPGRVPPIPAREPPSRRS